MRGARIRFAHPAGYGERMTREGALEPAARSAAADFARAAGVEIAIEDRARNRPDRRDRREPVDRGHVLEDLLHPVARALRVPLGQHAREPLRVRSRVTGSHEAALDLTRRAPPRFGIQRVAAEK